MVLSPSRAGRRHRNALQYELCDCVALRLAIPSHGVAGVTSQRVSMCIIHFSSVYDTALAPDHRGENLNTVGRYRCPALHCTCRNEGGVHLSETTYLSSRCAGRATKTPRILSLGRELLSQPRVNENSTLGFEATGAVYVCSLQLLLDVQATCCGLLRFRRPRIHVSGPAAPWALSLSVFCGCSRASS